MSGAVGGKILNPSKWAYLTNLDGARMMLASAKDRWRSPENPGSGALPRTLSRHHSAGTFRKQPMDRERHILDRKEHSARLQHQFQRQPVVEKHAHLCIGSTGLYLHTLLRYES